MRTFLQTGSIFSDKLFQLFFKEILFASKTGYCFAYYCSVSIKIRDLKSVGGDLRIVDNAKLLKIDLQILHTIGGNLVICGNNENIGEIMLPQLNVVHKIFADVGVTIQCPNATDKCDVEHLGSCAEYESLSSADEVMVQ